MKQTQNTTRIYGKTFLGLVLQDTSYWSQNASTLYCYLIEEGAYCWIYLNEVYYIDSKLKSPYNGKQLQEIEITKNMLERVRYIRSWCPELYFSEYISYHSLAKKLLRRRLTKYLEIEKRKNRQEPKLRFTLKNMKEFLGVPKIKTSDFCISCTNRMIDKKKLVCDTCREFLEDEVKLSGVSSYTKYLPKGLMKDPLEILFEDIGIKYKNRRYKWFETYKKAKIIKSKAKKVKSGSKVKYLDDLPPGKANEDDLIMIGTIKDLQSKGKVTKKRAKKKAKKEVN